MNTKPEIRYTKGPETLSIGSLTLVRADLDVDAKHPEKSLNGWRETTEEIAESATREGHVAEYGFEARNYTRPAPTADSAAAPAAPSKTSRMRGDNTPKE